MEEVDKKQQTIIKGVNIAYSILTTLFVVALLVLWGMARLVNGLMIFFVFPLFIGYIIVSVVFFGFHFFKRHNDETFLKKEKKYFARLGLCFVFVSVISISGIELKYHDITTYTREKWLSGNYDRGRLVHSFLKEVDLTNKGGNEAIYYLGEPDYISEPRGNDDFIYAYNYYLGSYLDWIDSSILCVCFNSDDLIFILRINSN